MAKLAFDFSDDAVAELDLLKDKLKVSQRGDVLNHGLGAMKWAVKEIEQGSKIFVVRPDGAVTEISFPEIQSMLRWAKFWCRVNSILDLH